ncbi:Zinc finger, C2H2 type family protein [Ditylenchus destructor]|uniref:Zinc finger, C2H2 type family protein n=1 Tax=Ditylenchus destructor TaxID=166010 RepID=A0AAD4RA26_9BILA|nr:Zinc finger, C2H2 type family protein [Ditylenchus destructor]
MDVLNQCVKDFLYQDKAQHPFYQNRQHQSFYPFSTAGQYSHAGNQPSGLTNSASFASFYHPGNVFQQPQQPAGVLPHSQSAFFLNTAAQAQTSFLPPPPSTLSTMLPPVASQPAPTAAKFILGGEPMQTSEPLLSRGTQQGVLWSGAVQNGQFQPQQASAFSHVRNTTTTTSSNANGNVSVICSIPSIPAVEKLRAGSSNRGMCRSSSSGILPLHNSNGKSSTAMPPVSFPSTASIASSLNTLAASVLGVPLDRFSPSSASCVSIDSGFGDASNSSYPASPDSESSNSGHKAPSFSIGGTTLLTLSAPAANSSQTLPRTPSSGNMNSGSSQMPSLVPNPPSQQCPQIIESAEPPMKMRKVRSESAKVDQPEITSPPPVLSPNNSDVNSQMTPEKLSDHASETIEIKYNPNGEKSVEDQLMESRRPTMDIIEQKESGVESGNNDVNIQLKERSVPLSEPEPRIEPAAVFNAPECEESTSVSKNHQLIEELRGQYLCGWADCEHRVGSDNALYDHVVKDHLDQLRPVPVVVDLEKSSMLNNSSSSRQNRRRRHSNALKEAKKQNSKDEECKFRCRWQDCDMSLQRGDHQKQFDWLLDHYTTRHAPRAQPFVCLFEQCSLRFRMRKSLNDHLRCAHDNVKNTGKKNGSSDEGKASGSCFGFRPRVQIPPRIDCMDTRTMEWVRDQLKLYNQMQKPCLVIEPQLPGPYSALRQQQILSSRAQFRKMRRQSTQFLMEFDKILSFKRSFSNLEQIMPEINAYYAPLVANSSELPAKMPPKDAAKYLSALFTKKSKKRSASLASSSVSSAPSNSSSSE